MNICFASSRTILLIGNMENTLNGISFQHVIKQAVFWTSSWQLTVLKCKTDFLVLQEKIPKIHIEEFCQIID